MADPIVFAGVQLDEKCGECGGCGMVQNPAWARYYERLHADEQHCGHPCRDEDCWCETEMPKFYESDPSSRLDDEEIPCESCGNGDEEGTGWVLTDDGKALLAFLGRHSAIRHLWPRLDRLEQKVKEASRG